MRPHVVIVLVCLSVVKAGFLTSTCQPTSSTIYSTSFQQYDVTDNSYTIHSHDSYGREFYYSNYRRCINIYTNRTDYVIKLEEENFQLEESYTCIFDSLDIYYTTYDNADTLNYEGKWCGTNGPGTKYSTNNHMFLHFYSDSSGGYRGFEFSISSIHKDDVPIQLSAGAIVGIVFGVLLLIAIIIVIVVCIVINKKKPGSVHAAQPNAVQPHRNVAVVSSNTYNNRQVVGGYIPPPQYQQQPPSYSQPGYNMPPVRQPAGPPQPAPLAQDPVYPPPSALYPPAQQPNGTNPAQGPPPAYGGQH